MTAVDVIASREAWRSRGARSIDLRARQLDHLAVFLVIRFEARGELLRRHEHRVERLAFKLLADFRALEPLLDVRVQLVDDRFRHACGPERADPRGEFESGNAG